MKVIEVWTVLECAITTINAFLNWFMGGYDGLLYALITFVLANYITGTFTAFICNERSSEAEAKGIIRIIKKVTVFIIVGIGNLADVYLLGGGTALRTVLIFFYSANELMDLIGSCETIDVPIPQVLRETLKQIKRKSCDKSEDNKEE